MDKRGQVALFVVIALVIVAVILVVLLYPQIIPKPSSSFSPNAYLSDCVKPEIISTLSELSEKGGYIDPKGSIKYQDVEIKYLCYTSQYYETCTVQQPLLIEHVTTELNNLVKPLASKCFEDLKQEYGRRGYSITSGQLSVNTSIDLDSINLIFYAPTTITRTQDAGESRTFKQFEINLESNYYELLSIATSIVSSEASLGGSETTGYLQYYPNLKIEKTKLDDGSTIYKLTNVVSKESFTFASRSLAWPAGYSTT